ncbi:hypothetical protein MRX96_005036 [Rhipicephalus microplus]
MSARTFSSRTSLALSLTVILLLIDPAHPWGGKKVKLKDVEVLTLRQGQYTTGPQCYNRGSDGYSTQWECKADMSKSQKFGTVEVTCEGYDYADDDYILAGSCGLEYRLEKTGYGGGSTYDSYKHSPYTYGSKSGSTFQTILFLAVVAFVIYAMYRTCLAPGQMDDAPPAYDDEVVACPPPPGFRPAYQTDASCGSARAHGAGGVGGGGFWTGAAAGGLLGYLLGNSNNAGYSTGYGYPREGTFRPSPSFSTSSFGGASTSSETHTSSGFGGTRRR